MYALAARAAREKTKSASANLIVVGLFVALGLAAYAARQRAVASSVAAEEYCTGWDRAASGVVAAMPAFPGSTASAARTQPSGFCARAAIARRAGSSSPATITERYVPGRSRSATANGIGSIGRSLARLRRQTGWCRSASLAASQHARPSS